MGEITEKRKRHYSGLDADKASIPAAGKSPGDSYFATDKLKLYYWQGGAWKTGLGYEYVERRVGAPDFSGGNPGGIAVDFDTDGDWHVDGLDLSGIVPAGAVAVCINMTVTDDAAASYFILRANATDVINTMQITTQVANIGQVLTQVIAIDSNRLMDYRGAAVAFTSLDVTIVGWFI